MRLGIQILWVFGLIAAFALLYVGALFFTSLQSSGYNPTLNPDGSQANVPAPQPIVNPFGTVTARTNSSVTISGVDGKVSTFAIASSTRMLDDKGATAKAGTLVVGALVSIEAQGSTATVIHIIPLPSPPPPPAR